MGILGILKRKTSISRANTTRIKSNFIKVRNKYIKNKWGGGHKWSDHFRKIKYM